MFTLKGKELSFLFHKVIKFSYYDGMNKNSGNGITWAFEIESFVIFHNIVLRITETV